MVKPVKRILVCCLVSLSLIGCATPSVRKAEQLQAKMADRKYNHCVDQIHARAKAEKIVWAREIDACMGRPWEEVSAVDVRSMSRAQFEALTAN